MMRPAWFAVGFTIMLVLAWGCGSKEKKGESKPSCQSCPRLEARESEKAVPKEQLAQIVDTAKTDRLNSDGPDLPGRLERFSQKMARQLFAKGENGFFSPYSISSCLAMVYNGAKGETAAEMAQALCYPEDKAAMNPAFLILNRSLMAEEVPVKLTVANSVWANDKMPLQPAYSKAMRRFYDAEIRNMDFRQQPEQSRVVINEWVSEKTEQKIQEIIPAAGITPQTEMVLVNAIYFLGDWSSPFPAQSTRKAPFHAVSGKDIPVFLMSQTGRFAYGENADFQTLEMLYEGGQILMRVVLPKSPDFISQGKTLKDGQLPRTQRKQVHVLMPRFKMETSYDLTGSLRQMGMKKAFSSDADFSGMAQEGFDLAISKVVHKAFVEVDEKGTEAAAATGTVMRSTSARPEKPVVFRADRPFFFSIRWRQPDYPLFEGVLQQPTAVGDAQ